MSLMAELHLNWSWLASLVGVSCMVLGLIFLLGRLFPQVAERERAERSLRKIEANLSDAQRIAHLGSFEWDIQQDRLFWSDEIYRILKLDKETFEPSVERYMSLVHPDDRAAVQAETDAALAECGAYDITFRILCSDGEERIIHERAEVEAGEAGRPRRMRGAFHDITERKRAEEEILKLNEELEQRVEQRTAELRAAQKELVRQERLAALGQLTGTVSHELRNPLGAMRTAVAAIKKLASDDHPLLRSSVGIVDRSITRCDNIIGDLLDYSRVRPLELESTQIDGWLAGLLDEYKLAPGVTLKRELASGVRLAIDDDRLRRALINVIDNACQAMVGPEKNAADDREHLLSVAAKVVAGQLEITVGDTGSGIARDDRKRIFEPLYSTKAFGVGLGLPLVKRVVEQHDGAIEVESEPGKASRFVIRLPLAAARQRAAS